MIKIIYSKNAKKAVKLKILRHTKREGEVTFFFIFRVYAIS